MVVARMVEARLGGAGWAAVVLAVEVTVEAGVAAAADSDRI